VGLLDSIFGRTKPARPDLDQLFGLPAAAISLEASLGMRPTGFGSVAFRAAEGKAFDDVEAEVTQLLALGGGPAVQASVDSFGFTWLLLRTDPPDVGSLVTDLHAVNSSLQDSGFGPTLLCSLASFADDSGRRLALVYLFKRGAFYPFAPVVGQQESRDNVLELQVRDLVKDDLRVEQDLTRWFPVWGAPGL
jgi:hypothetical protein